MEDIRILIIEKLAGSIEPADDLVLEQLIKDDVSVRTLWQEMAATVSIAESKGFSVRVDDQKQWAQLEPLLTHSSKSKVTKLTRKLFAAASVLLVISGGYWLVRKSSFSKSSPASVAISNFKGPTLQLPGYQLVQLTDDDKTFKIGEAVLETRGRSLSYTASGAKDENWVLSVPPGSDYKVQLTDGTQIWLNAASSLTFEPGFSGNTRQVSMQGEAFFKVAKNKLRPFIVHTALTDVHVTGTAFNVNSYKESQTHTALVEGAVTLNSDQVKDFPLLPGYEAMLTGNGFQTRAFDTLEVLSWMKGIYYFRNTPLRELSQVIKRWYDVDAEFAASAIAVKMFSGELRKDDSLQVFLDNLNISGEIHAELKEGRIYFR